MVGKFLKNREANLKLPEPENVTRSEFHTGNPQILCLPAQNTVRHSDLLSGICALLFTINRF
jgi:hypothetical protein